MFSFEVQKTLIAITKNRKLKKKKSSLFSRLKKTQTAQVKKHKKK